jgi:hypothetical protein
MRYQMSFATRRSRNDPEDRFLESRHGNPLMHGLQGNCERPALSANRDLRAPAILLQFAVCRSDVQSKHIVSCMVV